MIKPILIAAAASLAAPAAFAGGFYVNAEANSGFTGSDYSSTTTDLHIGYEGGNDTFDYYVQGGPQVNHTEAAGDSDLDFSGKAGASYSISDATSVYGELSGASDEDANGDSLVNWGAKAGVKFTF